MEEELELTEVAEVCLIRGVDERGCSSNDKQNEQTSQKEIQGWHQPTVLGLQPRTVAHIERVEEDRHQEVFAHHLLTNLFDKFSVVLSKSSGKVDSCPSTSKIGVSHTV